jgi:hypothetical protein
MSVRAPKKKRKRSDTDDGIRFTDGMTMRGPYFLIHKTRLVSKVSRRGGEMAVYYTTTTLFTG